VSNGKLIFVTGMVATGKTTIGKRLAYTLSCQHIDIDNDIRKLLGRVDPAVNTHSGTNKEIGRLGHQILFEVAGFWATYRSGERIVFSIPMIMPNRQELLQKFCERFPGQIQIIVLTLENDTDEEIARRFNKRIAEGYVGGVNTLMEYRRVKSIATPMPLPHTVIDTSLPRSIEECTNKAFDIVFHS
jgi:Shikimate kinase